MYSFDPLLSLGSNQRCCNFSSSGNQIKHGLATQAPIIQIYFILFHCFEKIPFHVKRHQKY